MILNKSITADQWALYKKFTLCMVTTSTNIFLHQHKAETFIQV